MLNTPKYHKITCFSSKAKFIRTYYSKEHLFGRVLSASEERNRVFIGLWGQSSIDFR